MAKRYSLISSDLIKKALYFAAEEHDGQYRKGTRVPYIVHPVLVALGILRYTNKDHVVAAAILHDVREDCPRVTKKQLESLFGSHIANIVEEVSSLPGKKEKAGKEWKAKKQAYLDKLKTASKEALIVATMDKMTNMQAYFEAALSKRTDLSKLFKGTTDDYFWYYGEIESLLMSRLGRHEIAYDYKKMLRGYRKLLKSS